jgi:hypothetical protein
MSKSSGTCDTHGSQDIRNCVGYALQTLSAGTIDAEGKYAIVYPANGKEPGPGPPPVLQGAGEQEVIAGSEADLAGSFFASSVDPWHQVDNLITGPRSIQRHGQFLHQRIDHGPRGASCMRGDL